MPIISLHSGYIACAQYSDAHEVEPAVSNLIFLCAGGGLTVHCDPCWSGAILPLDLRVGGKLEHSSEPQAENTRPN